MISSQIKVDKLPAVPAHDLKNETTLMRVRGCEYAVDGLEDAMQCRVGADGHVGPAEVVIDAPNEAHDVQMRACSSILLVDISLCQQFIQQRRPFSTEHVRARQAPVAPNADEIAYAIQRKVFRRLQTSTSRPKLFASRTSDNSPTLYLQVFRKN